MIQYLFLILIISHLICDQASANEISSADRDTQVELPSRSISAIQKSDELAGQAGGRLPPFGAFLFKGKFAQISFTGFNPDYQVNVGDQISVRIWGAADFDQSVTVDPRGNIFIPTIGPVSVLNVRNSKLQDVIHAQISKLFQKNVNSYTSLTTNQQVKVYTTGFVINPGLYAGLNTDSVLYFIDKAGGIDHLRGSFRKIKLLRNGRVHCEFDLYKFILRGEMRQVQFHDGDTILVEHKLPTVRVTGFVQNYAEMEITEDRVKLREILDMARVFDNASHIRLLKTQQARGNFQYFSIVDQDHFELEKGDIVEVVGEHSVENITVRLEGESSGQRELVLAPGTKLKDIMSKIVYTTVADKENLQIFRQSVKKAQKERLTQALDRLERAMLSASAASKEEAELRAREADLIMKMVDRAKKLEPQGQVVLGNNENRLDFTLESGDIIYIPKVTDVVMVHGEVLFPNAVVYQEKYDVDDYISQSGGFSDRARDDYIVILHKDGSFSVDERGFFSESIAIKPGDEIFVLPEVDTKTMQLTKDIAQILYQIAITTKVALSI